MNYNKIFSTFPILEGSNIRLRKVVSRDIPILFHLLDEADIIKEYSPIGRYQNLQQVADNFLFGPDANFADKNSIVWAIEDKKSSQIIGIRELYIDDPIKPVTVQGFIGKAYRNSGLSKEAYNLIINFAKDFGATGIIANASIENYSAIALMYSVGFEQKYVSMDRNFNMRAVFFHDLSILSQKVFPNEVVKRIYIFCKMYLKGTNIEIVEKGTVSTDLNKIPHSKYLVNLIGINTESNSPFGVYSKGIEFYSDGTYIWNPKTTDSLCLIAGNAKYVSSWAYIWKFCAK